jgi:hypothetical protein
VILQVFGSRNINRPIQGNKGKRKNCREAAN